MVALEFETTIYTKQGILKPVLLARGNRPAGAFVAEVFARLLEHPRIQWLQDFVLQPLPDAPDA